MDARALFGISALMSLMSSVIAAKQFVWPWLRSQPRAGALTWLVAPHMFIRFMGLSFLVPGVVSATLPKAWAVPAAYGDFIAGVFAIIATVALSRNAVWSAAVVWIFNVWGLGDLLLAFYRGAQVHLPLMPGALGAGYYLVTAVVPLLIVSHVLIFGLLVRSRS